MTREEETTRGTAALLVLCGRDAALTLDQSEQRWSIPQYGLASLGRLVSVFASSLRESDLQEMTLEHRFCLFGAAGRADRQPDAQQSQDCQQ